MGGAYKSLSGSEKADPASANGTRKQKSRVLIVPSRGVTYRHRHLIQDLDSLLPHGKLFMDATYSVVYTKQMLTM